jgi:hypothetical protein
MKKDNNQFIIMIWISMQEASGSDLKFIINYVKGKRGMVGIKAMLKSINSGSVLLSDVNEIGSTASYTEDTYKKIIEAAAVALGGDLNIRMNQIGYALGDRAKMTRFVAKLSTAKQVIKILEDRLITEIPYVKSSVQEISKHIVILRVTARKNGENFLQVADGYISAVLDQLNKSMTVSEKKIDNNELVYKFTLGEKDQE